MKRALNSYKAQCAKFYKGKGDRNAILTAWEALRAAWYDMPNAARRPYADFHDFLACNDCVSFAEIMAER